MSNVTATTTVRPCLAAIVEFPRTAFHRREEWVAERMDTNELYWRGTEHVCAGSIGWPEVTRGVVIHAGRCNQEGWWAGGQKSWCVIGVVWAWPLAVEVECVNISRHEGRWDGRG